MRIFEATLRKKAGRQTNTLFQNIFVVKIFNPLLKIYFWRNNLISSKVLSRKLCRKKIFEILIETVWKTKIFKIFTEKSGKK